MEKPIQIVYTNEAEERLEKLMNKFKSDIEFLIKNMRYVPGDRLIEITGSDIEIVSKNFKMISPDKNRSREFIINLYLTSGTMLIIFGLFFNEFKNLLQENPIQLMLVLIGATMIFAGLWAKSIINRKKYKSNLAPELKD
ncbi:MAG: hypothetical protein KAI84_07635 [Gammaproteobacteria bacterium]|nr:hypothetical protein [Gammaproteobacteria bacterium]